MEKTIFYRGMQIKTNCDGLYFICDGCGSYCEDLGRTNTIKKAKERIDQEREEGEESYGQTAEFEQMHY